jgi:gamma-glutamyltranspeptidase/glutathione hydrolase
MRGNSKICIRAATGILVLLAFASCSTMAAAERLEVKVGEEVIADLGGVSAEHPLSVRAGLEMLQKGGNAVDAIVAAAFANAVVDHGMNGLGAYGGAMVIHLKKTGKPVVIDFTTRAPLAAQENMYEVVPGRAGGGMGWWETKNNEQRDGYKSISIPAGVAGLTTALEKYGTIPLKEILQPAIRYAEEGFPISDWYAAQLASAYPRFKNFPETVKIFCRRDGSPLKGGDRLVQKDLAKSLRILAEKGPDVFYQGELAQKMLEDIQKNGGIITPRDFADWRSRLVRIQEPAMTTYRGYTLATSAICTGGENLLHILNILEGYDLAGTGPLSAKGVHLMLEAMKLGFADRLAFVTDPEVHPVPYKGLISREYAAENRNRINPDMAMPWIKGKVPPGDPWKYEPGGKPKTAALGSGWNGGSASTASTSAVDKEGNMVALTYTITWFLGSSVTIPGTGIDMNNGMTLFNPNPGDINSIKPGRLALNNMAATVILKDDKPFMSLGGSGGRAIMTELTELIVNVIDYRMDIQKALAAPRFHAEDGEPIEVEWDFPVGTAKELEKMGHQLLVLKKWGGVHALMLDPRDDKFHIGCEPRIGQSAAGGLSSQ